MGCYSHHLNKASSKKVPPRLVCTEQHKIERIPTYGYNSRDGYQHCKTGARSVLPHHRPGPRRDLVLGCTGIHYCFGDPVHNRQARLGYFPGPVATHLLAPCPIPQAIEPFKVVLFKKQRPFSTQMILQRTARRCISSTWYVSSLSALIAFTSSGNAGTISTTFVAAWCTIIVDSTM